MIIYCVRMKVWNTEEPRLNILLIFKPTIQNKVNPDTGKRDAFQPYSLSFWSLGL